MELLYLCICAFIAGFVDSVVGGGGLIQLPALFIFLPPDLAASVPLVLGTNKVASMCGTSVAVLQYARRVRIQWSTLLPAAVAAFVFSAFGARVVMAARGDLLRPIVLFLLIGVAIYTYVRKDLGSVHAPRFVRSHEQWAGIAVGVVIGFYDGFFGPGTGSFLMFIFIGVFGLDFLSASASSKVINLATNIAAVIAFAWSGYVLLEYALPMAAANIAGAIVGSRLAVLKGNRFVRVLFLWVVLAMIARFAWEQFGK